MKDIESLAQELVAKLTAAGLKLATAESCTGGWVAKAVTDIAGSSAVFGYGIVSYADAAKQDLLGVDPDVIARDGAVSEAVVRQMAAGVLAKSGAGLSVAISGIAGPGGGSKDKPVGTVWFAWARHAAGGPVVDAVCQRFDGDRKAVREQSVVCALQGCLDRNTGDG